MDVEDGGKDVVPVLRGMVGYHAHARKAGVVAFDRRAQCALAFGANAVGQQAQPALAKTGFRRHAQRFAAGAVHMGQRAVHIENLDAVDAGVQHVFLHAQAAIQILLRHDAVMDVHAADMPVRHMGAAVLLALRRQQCPAPVAAVVAQAVFPLKAGTGAQRLLPELAGVKFVIGVQALQPAGVSLAFTGKACPGLVVKQGAAALVRHPDQLRQGVQCFENRLAYGLRRVPQPQ